MEEANNRIDGIDHAMIGVRDLDEATRKYQRLGFAVVVPGGRHLTRGTQNNIIRCGWGFIELITICDAAERGRLNLPVDGLTDLLKVRSGGYVDVILQTHVIDQLAESWSSAGVPLNEFSIERARPDGLVTKNRIIAPTPASIRHLYPSLIQWSQADPERLSPQLQASHPNGSEEIVAVSVIVNDLRAARTAYLEVLGVPGGDPEVLTDMGAHRIRCRAGSLTVDLLAANGPGIVATALENLGEGLFEVRIRSRNLDHTSAYLQHHGIPSQPAPGVSRGLLLPIDATAGARIVLVE